MDIITFSQKLQERLKEIDSLSSGRDDLVMAGKALSDIRAVMDELKHFAVNYSFKDVREEIVFFKETKPVLMSQYFFYKKMFAVMLYDSFAHRESRIENYYKILQKLQNFARKNQAFYEYCMSGATYLDGNYFTRNNQRLSRVEDDEKFSTGYDTKLSKILAHELIKQFVIDALRKLQEDKSYSALTSLSWTDSKVALTELIYALHSAKVFNNGRADIKHIVQGFEEHFSVDLGNYSRVFSEIRIRKSGQTNFLDHLKERLALLINGMD